MLQGKAGQGPSIHVAWGGRQRPLAQTPPLTPCSSLVSQGLNTEASLGPQVPLGPQVSQATCGPALAWRTSLPTCTVRHREEGSHGKLHCWTSHLVLLRHIQGWALESNTLALEVLSAMTGGLAGRLCSQVQPLEKSQTVCERLAGELGRDGIWAE